MFFLGRKLVYGGGGGWGGCLMWGFFGRRVVMVG